MDTNLQRLWRVLALIAALAFATPLWAGTQVSIGDLEPADRSVLAPGASVYVLMNYETDVSVKLWARPYSNGVEVPALTNASPQYTGTGEALGWFALSEAGVVDEIRIKAGGGDPYREWVVTTLPVRLEWSTEGQSIGSQAAWVDELSREQTAQITAQARQRASESGGAMDGLIFAGFLILVGALLIGGIALPLRSALRWRGGWRIAALAPLGLMGFVILRIVVDTAIDPTSHNLWPFEILMFGVAALVIIVVLMIARR
ncbi:MAG TPA: hypothetical protein PKE27_20390, partial [Povalibacter sp.]|uniref:hypothetical protein n=1 Tax=Povalibacter sp. TaxID=1962978 RepID=UPI002B9F34FE